MKRLFLSLSLTILFSACSPSRPNSTASVDAEKQIQQKQPEFTIDAPKLFEEFRAAEADSKTKYVPKVLLVTGRVDSTETQLSRNSSSYEVTLINDITCYFAPAHGQRIVGLKAGDTVTIKGRCKAGSTSGVTLEGCTFQ